jgi:hypothetical protein
MTTTLLEGWDSFYVITGSSAAGLTGLTFVVIALATDTKRVNPRGLRAYVTPNIVHFGTVLGLAAYLSMPHPVLLSLSLAFGAIGLAGLGYIAFVGANIGRVSSEYVPVWEDWIFHVMLPAIAYGALLAAGCLIWSRLSLSLYGIAAASLMLLFIGIHNTWDIAVYQSLRKMDDPT